MRPQLHHPTPCKLLKDKQKARDVSSLGQSDIPMKQLTLLTHCMVIQIRKKRWYVMPCDNGSSERNFSFLLQQALLISLGVIRHVGGIHPAFDLTKDLSNLMMCTVRVSDAGISLITFLSGSLNSYFLQYLGSYCPGTCIIRVKNYQRAASCR